MPIYIQYYDEFIIGSYEDKLCLLDYKNRKNRTTIDNRLKKYLSTNFEEKSTKVIEKTIKQLEDYFKGKRKAFDIPLLFLGTDFQKMVWKALENIPYGETISYMQIAKNIKNEKAIRAVANANNANALAIIVPCHRVIGSDGKLVGYAGGLDKKQMILNLEKGNK